MRLSEKLQPFVLLAAVAAPFLPTTHAWGFAGHEIVATIAQIHLHPSALPAICNLLDIVPTDTSEATLRRQCHLAPISTWADKNRMKMRWSAAFHYVGAVDDHPGGSCTFPGEHGWEGHLGVNVLDGIKNTTKILADWSGVSEDDSFSLSTKPSSLTRARFTGSKVPGPLEEEAFKFLVHFVGDMHQPLHLTGRDRGGNGQKVVFEGRESNLHSVWDTAILTRLIRTVAPEYKHPLPDQGDLPIPSRQIELALRGTIYDALIRRVMWEGVEHKWIGELEEWLACPEVPQGSSLPKPVEVSRPSLKETVLSAFQDPLSLPSKLTALFAPHQGVEIRPDGPLICPYAWATPLHQLNCQYIWPPILNLTENAYPRRPPHSSKYPVLDTKEYMAALDNNLVMEKLLAQGGIRLAAVLNWLFADAA